MHFFFIQCICFTMSVRKKAVGKRVGKPAAKKRYKIISPRLVSMRVQKGYVKAGTPTFFNVPTGKA